MSGRALRSRGAAAATPSADPPKKRASRKKTQAFNDALATSVEGVDDQIPMISETESEIQASADTQTRSPSPSNQLQPQQPMQTMSRRTTRSMSREVSPSLATSSAPAKVKKTSIVRVTSKASNGSHTPNRPRRMPPNKSGNNKRKADDSASEQDVEMDTDPDTNSRPMKRVRRELSAATAPFSPIPEAEEEEEIAPRSTQHSPRPSQQLSPFTEVANDNVQPSMERSTKFDAPKPEAETPEESVSPSTEHSSEVEAAQDAQQPAMEDSPKPSQRSLTPTPAPLTPSPIVLQPMEHSPEAEDYEDEDAAKTTSGSREESAEILENVSHLVEHSPKAEEPEDSARTTGGSREESVEILESVSHSMRHSPEAPQESMQCPSNCLVFFPRTSTRPELIISDSIIADELYKRAQELSLPQFSQPPATPSPIRVEPVRGFFTSAVGRVVGLVASPFKFMSRQDQNAADAVTTNNNEADTPQDIAQDIPQRTPQRTLQDTPQDTHVFTYQQSHNLDLSKPIETPSRAPRPRVMPSGSQSVGSRRNYRRPQTWYPKSSCPKPINPKPRSTSPFKFSKVSKSQVEVDGHDEPSKTQPMETETKQERLDRLDKERKNRLKRFTGARSRFGANRHDGPSTPQPIETEQERVHRLSEERKNRLKQVRARLDAMTPEEKALHDQKINELAKKMEARQRKIADAFASDESRKRQSRLAFPDIDENSSSSKKRKTRVGYRAPDPNDSSSDEEGDLTPKNKVASISTTPIAGGGSPMDLDSPSILGHELPAELAHPADRCYNALFYRQVELFQAEMTEEERKEDNENMKLDFKYWKLIHLYYSTMKEEEDEAAWRSEAEHLRKDPWSTEDGIAAMKEGYLAKEKSRREKLQLADIKWRKEKLGEKDPYNIFLKAKQLEQAKEQAEQAKLLQEALDLDAAKPKVVEDANYLNTQGTFTLDYDAFSDSDSDSDDEEDEGEKELAPTAEQTVNDQAATPPPPPRPSNAQLPPAGIGMAAFQKYKPAVPSKLRHVEEMSPLQIEKEKAKRESMGKENQANENQIDLRQTFMESHQKYLDRKAAGGVMEFVGEDEELAEEMNKWM